MIEKIISKTYFPFSLGPIIYPYELLKTTLLNFALTYLILELHYCVLVTYSFTQCDEKKF